MVHRGGLAITDRAGAGLLRWGQLTATRRWGKATVNAEMILVRASADDVRKAIANIATAISPEQSQPLPLPAFVSRPDVRMNGNRTLILVEDEPWTAIFEGGEVADEFLGRALSQQLDTETVIVGRYDTANACARRSYARGRLVDEQFTPPGAFEGGRGDEEWDGDASYESRAWLEKEGWNHGVITFGQLIRGGDLPGISASQVTQILFIQART
jgi:hypothetical protein